MCNRHHSPSSQSESLPVKHTNPVPSLPHQPLATPMPLSVSMPLTTLDASYNRNYTICVLLWLAYFTWHRICKVHPCCSRNQTPGFQNSGVRQACRCDCCPGGDADSLCFLLCCLPSAPSSRPVPSSKFSGNMTHVHLHRRTVSDQLKGQTFWYLRIYCERICFFTCCHDYISRLF